MARKSLRPHMNQIRSWVRQGRTDAWVAHQLEVPVQDIIQFKEQNDLMSEEELGASPAEFPEEFDLRAEDDALIAAELEAAALEAEREKALAEEEAKARKEAKEKAASQKREKAAAKKRTKDEEEEEEEDDDEEELSSEAELAYEEQQAEDEHSERGRRRGRRGGRKRRPGARAGMPIEGTFDHGEEGYGLWLDPAVQDDPIYAEHWAGHRPVEVTIEEEQIVIRRVREDS